MARPKIRLELTGKQIEYLSVAFFEFGEAFTCATSEYMFKEITKKLNAARATAENEDRFYEEKAMHKAQMKVQNAKERKKVMK